MTDPQPHNQNSTTPSFLKRWLGWRILALSAVVLILLSPLLYRGWRLSQIPVTDDPFDVETFLTKVPENENAGLLVLEAAGKLVDIPETDRSAYIDESFDGWDPGDATLDRSLKANLAAIQIWRIAADRSKFKIELDATGFDRRIEFYVNIRSLNQLTVHQIEKCIATGDPQAAIPWIEAILRHAHLFQQNSSEFSVLVGTAFFTMAAEATNDWSSHPDLQRVEIEQVLESMKQARLLKPPLSDNFKSSYLSYQKTYGDKSIEEYIKIYRDYDMQPPLDSKWKWWLEAEPEYSNRLFSHITKNHLLFIDEERRDRPPLIDGGLFDDASVSPVKRGELNAQELSRLMIKSHLFATRNSLSGILDAADRDDARYRCLTVALAAQAYFRDYGEFPSAANQLVPEYLKEIPDDLYSPTPAPLIYRRDGNGAVVYSRYQNEIDDGGSVVNYDEHRTGGDLLDFGFRIRNPFEQPLKAPKP